MEYKLYVVDIVVFIVTFCCALGIGVFYAFKVKKKTTAFDYFLTGRTANPVAAVISLVASFQSSLLIVGLPAEVYAFGSKYLIAGLGILFSYIVAAFVVVPVFHPLKVTSVYSYIYLRYHSNGMRYMSVALGITWFLLYMGGGVTFGTGLALASMIGIPLWVAIVLFTTVATIYTAIGGMKTIIWTDVLQLTIMVIGTVTILVKSSISAGGGAYVLDVAKDRLDAFDFSFDPRIRHTFWNTFLYGFVLFYFNVTSQAGIQRINSVSSTKAARTLLLFGGPLHCITLIVTGIEGATVFAYYYNKGCDILETDRIKNVNEIMPVTVLELFDSMPGLPGIFIAALASAGLSSISSCLGGLTAITYEDGIQVRFPNINTKKYTQISKVMVVIYGCINIGVALLISNLDGPLIQIFSGIQGIISGPLLAIFVVSLLYRRATTKGLYIGTLVGMVITAWILFGKTFVLKQVNERLPHGPTDKCDVSDTVLNLTTIATSLGSVFTNTTVATSFNNVTDNAQTESLGPFLENLYSISYTLIQSIGFVLTVSIVLLVSICTSPPKQIDERCMLSVEKFWSFRRKPTHNVIGHQEYHPDGEMKLM